jgi:hypothetical protein
MALNGLSPGSNDIAGRVEIRIRQAESGDHPVAPALRGTEMNEEHLIFIMLDDPAQLGPASREIPLRELAFENRVLEMVAESTHRLEDLAQPAIVGDVVTDQVGLPH